MPTTRCYPVENNNTNFVEEKFETKQEENKLGNKRIEPNEKNIAIEKNENLEKKEIHQNESENNINIKKLWGGILVNLRRQNEFMLQTMIGTLNEYFVKDSLFVIIVNDEIKFETLNKPENYKIINRIVNVLSGLTTKFEFKQQKEKIDDTVFKLKEKLGDILKIEE